MNRPAQASLAHALARHLSRPPAPIAAPAPPSAEPGGVLLMSIKPQYARLIEKGLKRVEFRRRIPNHVTAGGRVLFYISSPVQAIGLSAIITRIHRAAPPALWRKVGPLAGAPKRDFEAYFAGAQTGVALVLEQVKPITPRLTLQDLRSLPFTPPQSSRILPQGDPLLGLLEA